MLGCSIAVVDFCRLLVVELVWRLARDLSRWLRGLLALVIRFGTLLEHDRTGAINHEAYGIYVDLGLDFGGG